MIVGVGIDLVDVPRFTATLARTPALRTRLFTAGELVGSPSTVAGRFAAKEAIAKALGAPGDLAWTDAEVCRTEPGRPYFRLRGSVAQRARELGVERVHLSISHDGHFVTAMVVAQGQPLEQELPPLYE